MGRLRRRKLAVPVLLALLMVAAGLVGNFSTGDARAQQGYPVPVEVISAATGTLERSLEAIGTLRSDESVVLRPELDGRVQAIHFEEGQRVAEGDLLITLDDAVIAASLSEAQANLRLAKTNLERARELRSKGSGTQRTLDEAEADHRIAQAREKLAQARFDKTRITAPFAGFVGLRSVSVGDYLSAGDDMVNLEAVDQLKVDFRVPELFLSDVAVGQPIHILVDAYPGREFAGQVYAINPLIDAAGRAIALRARVDNLNGQLRPGLFARVRLVLRSNSDSVLLPEQALVPTSEGNIVYRVVDGKAVATPVETGIRRDAKVEILKGIAPGEQVVTAGHLRLRDGSIVKIMGAG